MIGMDSPTLNAREHDCTDSLCGTNPRDGLDAAAAAVWDALFPRVLQWEPGTDCEMPRLMRNVALTAADAVITWQTSASEQGVGISRMSRPVAGNRIQLT